MAYIPAADRVLETSTTTGTGALTLAGAVTGFMAFSAITGIAANDALPYSVWGVDSNGAPTGEWETGIGTWNTTLTRTLVTASSNAGAAVNFSAGTKMVSFAINASTYVRSTIDGVGRNKLSTDFMSLSNQALQSGEVYIAAANSGTWTSGPASTWMDHPGTILLRSSTTANSGITMIWGASAFNGTRSFDPAQGAYRLEVIFRTPASNTGNIARFGTSETSSAAADPSEGGFFELLAGTWAMTSNTTSGSTNTKTALATLSASTWYHIRQTANVGNTALLFELFAEDGSLIAQNNHTTNLPDAALYPCVYRGVNTGTTAVDLVTIDYASFEVGYGKTMVRGRAYG